jgi:amidase
MPELGLWPFTESAAWGTTRNPWRLDRTPGGSSGGSAAAVAAGLAAGAVGGDGGGSIRTPAGCCGVVGIKPQRGRVSLSPLEHDWYGLVVLGPIARSVLDAALLLDAMTGPDRAPASAFADAARHAPGRLRVGVWSEPPPGSARPSTLRWRVR